MGVVGCFSGLLGSVQVASADAEDPFASEPDVVKESEQQSTPESRGRNNFSLSYQQDLLVLRSTRAACSTGSSYECYFGDGVEFDSEPLAPQESNNGFAGNQISSGFATSTGRLLLGYDRTLTDRLAVGIGIGWAFGLRSVPASLQPVHAEVRGSYFFAPQSEGGLLPYVSLASGLAQGAAFQTLIVFDRANRNPQTGETPETELEAWTNPGPAFAGVSLGTLLEIGASLELLLELRSMVHFPEFGFGTGLRAGVSRAF